ncbi:MAG: FHA domain-containing protein [Acidobacteria bacterium]|jgi:pSer/pThr/pTyr-binding forkhead associated (FHA) protein|nr:FHA domain-containing protein [Acidobacteriota bacterium]
MPENKLSPTKKSFSPDWFVGGILTRLGDMFDRFAGRNWQPSSSLAASEIIERLKRLLDSEVKDLGAKGKFVPHNIKLKMQWDKFSIDAQTSLEKLKNELLVAAIDHINDRRYHTYAPIELEIMPDYFTDGIKLQTSFEKFADDQEPEGALNVTMPDLKNVLIAPLEEVAVAPAAEIYIAELTVYGKIRKVELAFIEKQRRSVGRTKQNDLWIDDESVSKLHAAFVLNSERQLMLADTGSTNGTFINGQRIAYGKAHLIIEGDKLKFGTVEVNLTHIKEGVILEDSSTDEDDTQISLLTNKEIVQNDFSTGDEILAENNMSKDNDFSVDGFKKKNDLLQTHEEIVLETGEQFKDNK